MQTFAGKVASLLFNVLSRFVIAFLWGSKHLLISWLQSPSPVILEPRNKPRHTAACLYVLFGITSWQIDGETVETVANFILGGSKITADGNCSHEIKRCLLPERKTKTSLDSILKSRDITWPTKVHLVKAMVFPVVMYGCESWTIKKAEHPRIDAFELWCWRRLLRVQGDPVSPS